MTAARLTASLEAAVARGDRGFVPFLVAGYPDLATSEAILQAVAACGADAIEIGIPYSDSLADGPVVQGAYHKALERGATLARSLEMIGRLTRAGFPPVVLMVAYNVVFRTGLERFAGMASEAGVSAILPPDLPVEEWSPLDAALRPRSIAGIRLVAPTTPSGRVAEIVAGASGFVYYISRKGVTGARDSIPEGLAEAVAGVRALSAVPVAVGFGIATPDQAAAIGRFSDAVVVGSALVRACDAPDSIRAVRELSSSLRSALTNLGSL